MHDALAMNGGVRLCVQLFHAPNNRTQTEWKINKNKNKNQNYRENEAKRRDRAIKTQLQQVESRRLFHGTLDYTTTIHW